MTVPPVYVADAEIVPAATLTVVLEDGMGVGCVYVLRGLAEPPPELCVLRPAQVPALLTTRDPGFVYFRYTGVDGEGRPLYAQIVKD